MKLYLYHLCPIFLLFSTSFAKETETDLLRKGKVITRLEEVKGSYVKKGITTAIMEAPFEKVWGVITDFEHYKEFMPRVEKSDLITKTEKQVKYFSELDMPWPISDVSYQCVVNMEKPKKHIQFELIKGTQKGVKAFNGTWDFEPFEGDQSKTLVHYNLFFEPEKGYPPWAVNFGTKHTIGNIMESVRERLKRK